jgi:uncharacterized membrane protein YfcA
MEFAVITLVAFIVSAVTLFSGFGLGTVLMPAFALFFPLPVAIAATAIVHLTNNLFKLGLLGRQADWRIVLRFAVPAAAAAILGAGLLLVFTEMPVLARYELFGRGHEVTPLKLVIGALIVGFALAELSPAFASLTVPRKYVALGGLLSGFFGGLSGNQGAFRSAFLVKAVETKEAFVATGVVCAVIVDITRLAVYGLSYVTENIGLLPDNIASLVLSAMLAAFAGAYFAKRLLKKVTYRSIQVFVSAAMIFIGAGLAAGAI